MNNKEKIEFLKSKGLINDDKVRFRVENQSCYMGNTKGILVITDDECYIDTNIGKVEINEYLSAYINTIEKIK